MSPTNPRFFALTKHGDQKYGENPYSFHLDACAKILLEESILSSDLFVFEHLSVLFPSVYLHDVLEDNPL